jgi:YfiH family protein
MADCLRPDWPAPANVHALQTLRTGGVSLPPWDGFNLGDHVGDGEQAVAANRAALRRQLPGEPLWLRQVHGNLAVDADFAPDFSEADAAVARQSGRVCAVMTADCLPVLFCDRAGSVVAAAHAGWRGLAAGVLENTVRAMLVPPAEILAWLGPAIGPASFEVGGEVRDTFVRHDPEAANAFRPAREGKWLADIFLLARQRLNVVGVNAIYGGGMCTVQGQDRFFSYRRDGVTGRMASLIWRDGV